MLLVAGIKFPVESSLSFRGSLVEGWRTLAFIHVHRLRSWDQVPITFAVVDATSMPLKLTHAPITFAAGPAPASGGLPAVTPESPGPAPASDAIHESETESESERPPKCPKQCQHWVTFDPKPRCPKQCHHHVEWRQHMYDKETLEHNVLLSFEFLSLSFEFLPLSFEFPS